MLLYAPFLFSAVTECRNSNSPPPAKSEDLQITTDTPSFENRYFTDPAFRRSLPRNFEYVHRNAFKGWGMMDLLSCYPVLKTPIKRQMILSELENEASIFGVSADADKVVCRLFTSEPNAELAKLIGFCRSKESFRLLAKSVTATNQPLNKMVVLALARRGDSNMFAKVEGKLRAGLTAPHPSEETFKEAASIVSYVHSAECMILFFDAIIHASRNVYEQGTFMGTFISQMIDHMKKYLAKIECSVSLPEDNDTLMIWWKQHRDQIKKDLLSYGDRLPPLNLTYSIIRY